MKLQKMKGELVDAARAKALVFRLAREECDAWVTWAARAAALMASELGVMIADHGVLESARRSPDSLPDFLSAPGDDEKPRGLFEEPAFAALR